MMQTLADTLLTVRERIERIRKRKESIGEQNTKAILIAPILAALGWDLEELDEVRREYRHKPQDNPVDYALFIRRSPVLFVEAKDLGNDLDYKWVTQTLSYATVAGVEWCVLTNGDVYRLYNAHAPVDVDEKLFREVNVSDLAQDALTFDTLSLLSKDKMGEKLISVLWNAHFIDRYVKKALEDMVRSGNRGLINLIRKKEPQLMKLPRLEVRESLKRAQVQVDFPGITIEPGPPVKKSLKKEKQKVQVSDLIQAHLISPPLELEQEYEGHRLTATIQQDGNIIVAGESYSSPSRAASMALKSVGAPPSPGRDLYEVNGWKRWKYRDRETGKLELIDHLRKRYRELARDES